MQTDLHNTIVKTKEIWYFTASHELVWSGKDQLTILLVVCPDWKVLIEALWFSPIISSGCFDDDTD